MSHARPEPAEARRESSASASVAVGGGGASGADAVGGEATQASVVVSEVFTSIQGESSLVGRPCTFVRLAGCDLRCSWCDTPHAFVGGRRLRVVDVVDQVGRAGVRFVTVTGGEPLLQPGCARLVRSLLEHGHDVQVETGGHRPFDGLDRRARIICDVKLPGSGEHDRVRWASLGALLPHDEVKLVVADRRDYEAARRIVRERLEGFAGEVILQPVTGVQDPAELAAWILADRLPVRFGIQLHAHLWPGRTGV